MMQVLRPERPLGPRITVLSTTRDGGISRDPYAGLNLGDHVGDDILAVAENRRRLAAAFGIERLQWLRQVHGTEVIRATSAHVSTVPEADAAWTDEPDLALAILTADCLPVVVAAPERGILGVAHAGWRGLVDGVLEALIGALPVGAGELRAWIGPGIGMLDYQVDRPVVAAVEALPDGADLARSFAHPDRAPGHWRLDLAGLAAALLERAGVAAVELAKVSTFSDQRCYSHRRATLAGLPATGRMATLVWRASELA